MKQEKIIVGYRIVVVEGNDTQIPTDAIFLAYSTVSKEGIGHGQPYEENLYHFKVPIYKKKNANRK
jgi:hypothetical protein